MPHLPLSYAPPETRRTHVVRWAKRIALAIFAALGIALGCAVIQFVFWYQGFKHRLDLADKHAPIVKSLLEADGRFREVKASSFTARNGCLLVKAVIPPGTRNEFIRMVNTTAPPVPIEFVLWEIPLTTQPSR